jgi:aspartate-semialdehyde dehydrogenase
MSKGFHVAIVGATGAVGQELMIVFQERNFPISELTLLASARSHGKKLKYCGDQLTIFEAKPDSFQGVDLAFFAGGPVSKELVPEAVKRGAVAIDNSSAFRLHPDVPLVVPEVNPDDVENHKGIISNPNCSTTIFVVPLKPIHQAARVKRVVVTTMQAVSGAGRAAVDELLQQTSQVLAGEEVDQPRAKLGTIKTALSDLAASFSNSAIPTTSNPVVPITGAVPFSRAVLALWRTA